MNAIYYKQGEGHGAIVAGRSLGESDQDVLNRLNISGQVASKQEYDAWSVTIQQQQNDDESHKQEIAEKLLSDDTPTLPEIKDILKTHLLNS